MPVVRPRPQWDLTVPHAPRFDRSVPADYADVANITDVFSEFGQSAALFAFMPHLPERIYRKQVFEKLKKVTTLVLVHRLVCLACFDG